MLTQPMVDKLHALRLRGMAEGFTQQQEDPQYRQLSFEERLALLVDQQWNWRENRGLARRLKEGRLLGPACVEDINSRRTRSVARPACEGQRRDPAEIAARQLGSSADCRVEAKALALP